ncbi:uridylate kinase-like [Panicum miliaceum]|uniref:UMP kinase n=1 Tax=Panicum miliaceum TaxID=4540 RepID=A0A3L6SR88_PANMI|nr:uridylate kinase-like [Panicum miliaceum]
MAAIAAVPASFLLRLPSSQSMHTMLSSSDSWRRPRALRSATPLSLSAKPRACAASAAGPDSSNFGNQTSQMPPFSFTLDQGSSRLKKPYRWRRVLLKVSGEALAGDHTENIDPKITMAIAREVASVTKLGVEVAIVVGGGNIFRGASWAADVVGLTAHLQITSATMESIGIPTRVQTAFRMSEVAEPYIRRRAVRHLEKGRVVIFAAGTGNPFFTTDTAAALRLKLVAVNAEVVLKATNVDGVYDADPRHNPNARLLETVSYHEVTTRDLSIMDMTAITLCQENNIPAVVFNLQKAGNIAKAIVGEKVGTFIGCTRIQEQNGNTLRGERRLVNEV